MGGRAQNDRKSMEGFFAIMDLINDPEKYGEAINDLIKRYDEAQAMVESIVPAKEIESMRSQSLADKHAARAMVENAKEKVKKIIAEAQINIDKDRRDAKDRLEDMDKRQKNLNGKISSTNIALDARERSLETREKRAAEKLLEGRKLYDEGRELKEEFEVKLQKIKDL